MHCSCLLILIIIIIISLFNQICHYILGKHLFASVINGKTLSLTEALFPGQKSSIPQNELINMTFNCANGQLDVHIRVSTEVVIIPQILSLSNIILSLRATIGSKSAIQVIIMSANTQLFNLKSFVAVRYNFKTSKFFIRGIPTDTKSLSMQNALKAVSGTTLKVPPILSSLSEITFLGLKEKDVSTIAIKGKSGNNVIVVILQNGVAKKAAVIADIHTFKLASFVSSTLNVDISNVPIFGSLTIDRFAFSASTGEITSSLLPQLYPSGSHLSLFGSTLPSGVNAAFTVDFANGVKVMGAFSNGKMAFKVPQSVTFVAKKLLRQIPNFDKLLISLPQPITDLLNAKIVVFDFDPRSKALILHATIPQITLIQNVLKLMKVTFNINAIVSTSPSIKDLTFSGTWEIGKVSLLTKVMYNGGKKLFHVTASAGSGATLSISTLIKSVGGISHNIPSQLTSLSLNSVVGNIYGSGKFFVAMSGTISNGKLYLLFYKGNNGVKVGVAASLSKFRLSDLVRSATGVDITSVPYFGSLVVPAMAIAITSGPIQSPALPHLFGTGSPLLSYNDMLPTGITSQFKLDIGSAKGVVANFAHGVVNFKLPKSVVLNIKSLVSQIPGVSDAMKALPSQITNILNAKVLSFSFNSTSKELSISGSLSQFTLVTGLLSITDVRISYDGVLGKQATTRLVDFVGTWKIGGYSILTSIHYDGVGKQLTVSSQSQGGKQLSIDNILQSLAGTTVPLPSVLSSFTFTGLSGKCSKGTAVIIVSGKIGKGKIIAVFQKSSNSLSAGAIIADVSSFKLSELVKSATGLDISNVPLLGPMVIPELKFVVATDNITSPLLAELAKSSSTLEQYKSGITKGVSGRFSIQIGSVTGISGEFHIYKLSFKIPKASTLSMQAILSTMPSIKEVLQTLPSQLSAILSANIVAFSYDPTSKELHFSGSIEKEVIIVPQFVSLSNVKISLTVVIGKSIIVKNLYFSGNWLLKKLPILTTVSYNKEEKRLDITGEFDKSSGGINIKKLVTTLSGQQLPIPSVLSSVTLKKLIGNKIGDTILISLSGTVGQSNIYLIYEKSSNGSAIAFAADTPKLRFSSLVSSATGIDITSFPYFGTLVIPQIGFTISSQRIVNPLISTLYPSTSPLTKFGNAISKGVTATFGLTMGNVKGIIGDYANGELELNVPTSVDLSVTTILMLIPGLKEMINNLPFTLREIGNARLHKLLFSPSTKNLQVSGSLKSLTIVPGFLSLNNMEVEFSGTIGTNGAVKFAKFKGDWTINALKLTTEVIYEKMLLITAQPTSDKSINIKDFIKGLTGTDLSIPPVLNAVKFTKVIGKVQGGTVSIVLLGQIGSKGKISIAYQKSGTKKVVAFAADIVQFKLADLVKTATGLDMTSVPFFGTFIIPALSFVISTKQFSTALFPDLNVPGMPKELLLENIPEGVKGEFLADIGSALGIIVDYSNNIFTMKVPPSVSFSLKSLLSVIPQIKSAIDTLPSQLKDILSAKITHLVFKPATKDLTLSLSVDSLTIVPNIILLKSIEITLDVTFARKSQLQVQNEEMSFSPHTYQFQLSTPAMSEFKKTAEVQTLVVKSLSMKAKWILRGIKIGTSVTYEKPTEEIILEGKPTGYSGLNIVDLIGALSSAHLSVPSIISSLKLTKVVATSNIFGTTVVLSATAGSTDVYLVFKKTTSGTATAIAADIEGFKLTDVIKQAMDVDVSKVPFIGSFVISPLAISVSTMTISSMLLNTIFDHGSPLQAYGSTLPQGLTAYFKTEIGGVTGIEVTYAEKLIDFNIPTSVSLSLKGLLSEIPKLSEVVKGLPSPLSDLLACNLKSIRFNPPTRTLSVAAKLIQISIIPNILQVKNLEILFIATLGSNNGHLKSLEFTADWILRNINIHIKVAYNHDTPKVNFFAIPKQGLNIRDLITSLTGKNLPIPPVINSASFTKIIGNKFADTFTFIFSGSIANTTSVHLVYKKFGTISQIAIAAGISSFKFSDLVQSAVNIDISNIPFFGTFSVPSLGFVISTGKLTTSLLSKVLPANSPLLAYGNTLFDGFSAKFETPLGNVRRVVGSYRNKILSFTVPSGVDASLSALISLIPGLDVGSLALPPVIGDILKIKLHEFSVNVLKREMNIRLCLDKFTVFENLLSISNMTLKLITKLSPKIKLSVEATGNISIGNMNLEVDLKRHTPSNKYILTFKSEKISIFGIAKQLRAAILPDDLNTILGQVFNLNILEAKIQYPFGVKPQQMLIKGIVEIFGLKTVRIAAVVMRYGKKIRMIQKYSFGSVNVAKFVKKLVGIPLDNIFLLNQEVDLSFIVSPATLKGVSLSIPEFKGFSLNKGISIKAPLGWPPGCESDSFCAVAKKLLGGAELSLQATIANIRSFILTASIGELKLGGGVILKKAGLEIAVGSTNTIGLVGSIQLKEPAITLGAAIRASPSGVQLEGTMSGCWYNAFGSSYLSICNMLLGMTIVPSYSPITGLEFGGRVEVGKRSCGKVLYAEAYIGINVVDITQNYFYADIGPLTFQSFLGAFCLNTTLPKALAESGYPDGIMVSFSILGKELPHAQISIQPGYRFKGTIQILGLRGYADINILLPTKISINVSLPPIRIGKLFKMYASKSDRNKGPYLVVDISIIKPPHIEASGFVKLLGISAEAKILITHTKYEFYIRGKLLQLIDARLHVTATYGNIYNASFLVEGWFTNSFFDAISQIVRNGLRKSASIANNHISAAQNIINSKKVIVDRADNSLRQAQDKVNDARRAFNDATAKMERSRHKVNHACSIQSCGYSELCNQ